MYNYFRGKVISNSSENLILEVNGIGYNIKILQEEKINIDNKIKIYVSYIEKEEKIMLYGFTNCEIRNLFESLQIIKGFGPKSVLRILNKHGGDYLLNLYYTDQNKFIKVLKISELEYKKVKKKMILNL